MRALRIPFLPASATAVLVGTSAALHETGSFSLPYFLITLLGVLLLHCGANAANDYYDYLSGADPWHPPYPFHGGSQVIQEGLLTPAQVRRLFLGCFILGSLCGLVLAVLRGPLVLLLGLGGVFCGFFYTAPPFKFAYRGLGELVTGLTFGPLSVTGSYFVQTGTLNLFPLAASLPLGFLIAAVLFVNQFPDAREDGQAGKRNLVVRQGARRARPGLLFLLTAAYVSLVSGIEQGLLPQGTLLVLLSLPLAGISLWYTYRYYDRPEKLVPASMAIIWTHIGSGIFLSLGYLIGPGKGIG